MIRNAVTVLALGTLAVCGCGGGGGDAADPGGLPASLASYCDDYAEAACRWFDRCTPGMVNEPQADCVARTVPECRASLESPINSYLAGRMDWHAPAAAQCLLALSEGECDAPLAVCGDLFTPAVDPGGACDYAGQGILLFSWGEQCKDVPCPRACGASCPVRAAVGEPCGGTECVEGTFCSFSTSHCFADFAPGATCASHDRCADGYYCADPHTHLRCAEEDPSLSTCACAAKVPEGAACGQDSINPYNPCQGAVCLDGTCQAFTGGRCNLYFPCEAGSFCDGLQPVTDIFDQGTCALLRGAGGECASSWQCRPGLACRTDGTCGTLGGAGALCTPVAEGLRTDCVAGLACDGVACAARPAAVGADCSAEMPCYGAGLACDESTGHCISTVVSCTSVVGCPTNHACEDGTCVAGAGHGASCTSVDPYACASGVCEGGNGLFGFCSTDLCHE